MSLAAPAPSSTHPNESPVAAQINAPLRDKDLTTYGEWGKESRSFWDRAQPFIMMSYYLPSMEEIWLPGLVISYLVQPFLPFVNKLGNEHWIKVLNEEYGISDAKRKADFAMIKTAMEDYVVLKGDIRDAYASRREYLINREGAYVDGLDRPTSFEDIQDGYKLLMAQTFKRATMETHKMEKGSNLPIDFGAATLTGSMAMFAEAVSRTSDGQRVAADEVVLDLLLGGRTPNSDPRAILEQQVLLNLGMQPPHVGLKDNGTIHMDSVAITSLALYRRLAAEFAGVDVTPPKESPFLGEELRVRIAAADAMTVPFFERGFATFRSRGFEEATAEMNNPDFQWSEPQPLGEPHVELTTQPFAPKGTPSTGWVLGA